MNTRAWIGGATAASVVGASFPVSEALVDYPLATGQMIRYAAGALILTALLKGRLGQADAEGARAAGAGRRDRHGRLQPGRARRGRAHGRDQHRRDHRRLAGDPRAHRQDPRPAHPDGGGRRWSPAPRSSTAPTPASARSAWRSRSSRSAARSASRCSPRRCSPASARCGSPPGRRSSPRSSSPSSRRGDVPTPTHSEAAAIAYLAVITTALAFVLWFGAVQTLGAAKAGLLVGFMPIAAVTVDAALNGRSAVHRGHRRDGARGRGDRVRGHAAAGAGPAPPAQRSRRPPVRLATRCPDPQRGPGNVGHRSDDARAAHPRCSP